MVMFILNVLYLPDNHHVIIFIIISCHQFWYSTVTFAIFQKVLPHYTDSREGSGEGVLVNCTTGRV